MYLRVSLTDRCNLRCIYCLPEEVAFASTRASFSELSRLTSLISRTVGVDKIRLTGGEPTLCEDLISHVRHARSLAGTVGMTTNGVLLEGLLPELKAAGLTRLNISLDAIDAEGFRRHSRRDGLDKVIASIRAAQRLGFSPLKINAVAMQDTDFPGLVRFAAWEGVHVRFIELMAIGEARAFQAERYIAAGQMRARIAAAGIHLTECQELDEPTSRIWTIDGQPASSCSVGFITTLSAPFCATCNRLRLSSQGRLFTCLMDNTGVDLLHALRHQDEAAVGQMVMSAVKAKRPPAQFVRYESMASIGG